MIEPVGRIGPTPPSAARLPARPVREVPPPDQAATGFRPLDRRAEFIAHLLATRDGLAQARAKRRAQAPEAVRAYAAVAASPWLGEGEELAVI